MNIYRSFSSIRQDIFSGKISVRELVSFYLDRIEKYQGLNAFREIFADESIKRAEEIDKKIKSGTQGELAGMVMAFKDNICIKSHKVSASSKILDGFVSPYHSTVAERLVNEDAIIIGSTNCDEFAMGSSNENSAFGNVHNPHDPTRVPGGSSGGSAAAVAADLCLAALGTDTGGSIRQPASFCGVIGLKPTYGRVSRYGIIAYASSFDQVGPITHCAEDAAAILEVMAGFDEYDSTLSARPVPHYSDELKNFSKEKKQIKIAYLKDCIEKDGLDPEIKKRMLNIIEGLKNQGCVVEPVEFPFLDYLVPAYYVLTTAEASSNLARYDGIRYGYRSKNADDLESTYKKSRTEGFGTEVKRRIMLGTFVLSAGYYDAYYSKGQKVRRLLQNKILEILSRYDFILLPTTPGTAFRFGENSADPIKMYLEDIFTVPANHAGTPAISLPLGKHSNGLPFGVQLIGRKFEEGKMLGFSEWMMRMEF